LRGIVEKAAKAMKTKELNLKEQILSQPKALT
jgi:hypothetical protein